MLKEQVARTLVNKAVTLEDDGQTTEAIATYSEIVSRFREATEPVLQDIVTQATSFLPQPN
ncbi:hypothetical protein BHS06_30225 [Myxococcus xanthus]|nr:hypothetical protein BHS06_30225 [Myxococcus xanthus]